MASPSTVVGPKGHSGHGVFDAVQKGCLSKQEDGSPKWQRFAGVSPEMPTLKRAPSKKTHPFCSAIFQCGVFCSDFEYPQHALVQKKTALKWG